MTNYMNNYMAPSWATLHQAWKDVGADIAGISWDDFYNAASELRKMLADETEHAAVRASHGQAPAPPPECETEAEKRAFAFGWFKALESERMKADNKKKGPL